MITLSKLDVTLGLVILALVLVLIYNHLKVRIGAAETPHEAEIHEIIETVRAELKQADDERIKKNEPALFEVKTFDLEINFLAKSAETQSGGLKTELVAISGGSEVSSERVQKITLHLTTIPPKEIVVLPNPAAKSADFTKTGQK
jgi:hypothetical protein